MSLFSALSKYNHLSELNAPLEIGGKQYSAAQRRALAIANLFAGDSTPAVSFPDTVTFVGQTYSQAKNTNSLGVGTVTTVGTTAVVEGGDGVWHQTQLTFTAFALGNSGDNANLALGAKFYTFPAGAHVVKDIVLYGAVTAAISATTDTPEIGIGSVIGSGAVAVLSSTLEDYMDGGAAGGLVGATAVLPDVAGTTPIVKSSLAANTEGVYIATSGGKSHDLFLNIADGWADVAAAGACTFTGTISFRWRKVS